MDKNANIQSKKGLHIEVLDELRGIAIIMVMLFHYWLYSWLDHSIHLAGIYININLNFIPESGFLGVELFFFISAFCLFYPYARYMFEGGKFQTLKQFTYRRMIKIIPSYYLSIFLIMIFFTPAHLGSFQEVVRNILAHMFFVHNIFPVTNTINGVYWSLGVEVQFYLVFPFLCMLFRKRPFITFAFMAGAAIFYRFFICYAYPEKADFFLMNQLPGFLDLFACGMLAAYITVYLRSHLKFQEQLAPFFTLLAVIAFALFIYMLIWFDNIKGFENSTFIWQIGNRHFFGLIYLVLGVSSAMSLQIWKTVLANKVLLFMSVISYNLYIWHQLLGAKLNEWKIPMPSTADPHADHQWQILYTLLAIAVSISFSALITYAFERPILKNGFKKYVKNIFTLLGLGNKKALSADKQA